LQEKLKAVQADPAAMKAAVEAGRKASFFCANCHGEEGISKTPDVPNLAGRTPPTCSSRSASSVPASARDAFMQGLIKVLKDDERLQISAFYASAKVPPSRADAALASAAGAVRQAVRALPRRAGPRRRTLLPACRPEGALPADLDHPLPRRYRIATTS
jgi:cytochrome c553